VRVSGRAFGFAGLHVDRAEVIEKDKGTDGLEIERRDRASNLEAVALKRSNGGVNEGNAAR
jgi:hypothetical protein